MLSLIIVSLVAGVCLGQGASKYSECDTVVSIGSQCATAHLGYLQNDGSLYAKMQMLGDLDIPTLLLPKLDVICNDTMELKKYFVCAFANVTTCLEEKNSTQKMGLPAVNAIAMGVVDMCKARADMNKTCIMPAVLQVQTCFGEAYQSKGEQMSDPCSISEALITCADALTECDGGEAVKDYVISARPRTCANPSSAPQYLPSFLMLIMAMLLAHSITFQ